MLATRVWNILSSSKMATFIIKIALLALMVKKPWAFEDFIAWDRVRIVK